MTDEELKLNKEICLKATRGRWGPMTANYPFYVNMKKPAPSLSKHDDKRPTYWRYEDAVFVLHFYPEHVLKLLEEIEYWKKQAVSAWDKCVEDES